MDFVQELRKPKVCGILCLFILIQLIIVIVGNPTQMMNDARSYVGLAKHAATVGHLYPTEPDLYGSYLFAPGYVNWLTAWFAMGFTERAPIFVNILFNVGILFEIYYLGTKAFNRVVGSIASLLFMLSITTYASILTLLTEQMFTFLAGLGLCLAVTNKKRNLLFAGILIGLANWIRPLGIIYLACIVLMCLFCLVKKSYLKQLFVGFIATALLIGAITYSASGIFAFQSSTFGVNLVMSANDYAHGNTSSGSKIFAKGEAGDLSDSGMTFKEKDIYWRKMGFEWIKEHPKAYFGMMPSKLARLYGVDIGFLDVFTGKDGIIQKPTYMKSILTDFPKLNPLQTVVAYNSIFYLCVFLFAVVSAILCMKKRNRYAISFVGLWLFGTLATLPFPCSSRYHYPYMMFIFILAAALLYTMKNKDEDNRSVKYASSNH